MRAKTVVAFVAVVFVIWWVVEQPVAAAHAVHSIGGFISTAASGMQRFMRNV